MYKIRGRVLAGRAIRFKSSPLNFVAVGYPLLSLTLLIIAVIYAFKKY